MKKSTAVFWVHWTVALLSHLAFIAILGGLINLLIGAVGLTFWVKALLFGITFFCAMYCSNHITNPEGFCVLTDVENALREKENLPQVGPFTPRFYNKTKEMYLVLVRLFKRSK